MLVPFALAVLGTAIAVDDDLTASFDERFRILRTLSGPVEAWKFYAAHVDFNSDDVEELFNRLGEAMWNCDTLETLASAMNEVDAAAEAFNEMPELVFTDPKATASEQMIAGGLLGGVWILPKVGNWVFVADQEPEHGVRPERLYVLPDGSVTRIWSADAEDRVLVRSREGTYFVLPSSEISPLEITVKNVEIWDPTMDDPHTYADTSDDLARTIDMHAEITFHLRTPETVKVFFKFNSDTERIEELSPISTLFYTDAPDAMIEKILVKQAAEAYQTWHLGWAKILDANSVELAELLHKAFGFTIPKGGPGARTKFFSDPVPRDQAFVASEDDNDWLIVHEPGQPKNEAWFVYTATDTLKKKLSPGVRLSPATVRREDPWAPARWNVDLGRWVSPS